MLAELLRAIEEAYDDDSHWHPLADWFMDRGDPRGELIAIDLALETGGDRRPALETRRAEILAESSPKLLGETFAKVVAEGYGAVRWRRGFVDHVEYRRAAGVRHQRAVGWLVAVMTEHREPFSLLRSLDLAGTDLADAGVLLAFPHLVSVDLRGTNVVDRAPLAQLRKLRHSQVDT